MFFGCALDKHYLRQLRTICMKCPVYNIKYVQKAGGQQIKLEEKQWGKVSRMSRQMTEL